MRAAVKRPVKRPSPQATREKAAGVRTSTSPSLPPAPSVISGPETLGLSHRLLPGPTWDPWRVALRCIGGDTSALSAADRQLVAACTGGRPLPTSPIREAWFIAGRRSGKSTTASLLAVAAAVFSTYRRSRGERPRVLVIASDREQASVEFDYIVGMLESSESLSQLITRKTQDCIDLRNGVRIQVAACSFRSSRGFSNLAVICSEISFWRVDDGSRNPAAEVLTAIRPSLATTNGLLIAISSPYSRQGPLFTAFERHYGKAGNTLVWRAASLKMNPGLDASRIDDARAEDAAAAASEWDAEFRADISSFIDPAAYDAVVDSGVRERPRQPGVTYYAHLDPSGGSQDSAVVGVSHPDGDRAVLDCVQEITSPHNPQTAVGAFAEILRAYGISQLTTDRYAPGWVAGAFESHGLRCKVAERMKSEIYLEALPLIRSKRCSLLDEPRLRAQALGLERKSGASGRDSVDHGPGGHDDIINAVCGALVNCKVGMGRAALPDAFTFCAKSASVPSFSLSSCYLAHGNYIPSDPICRECPGHLSAQTMYARYRADGGTLDVRSWARESVKLPAGMQWAQFYSDMRRGEEQAGQGYQRFIDQQRQRTGWR